MSLTSAANTHNHSNGTNANSDDALIATSHAIGHTTTQGATSLNGSMTDPNPFQPSDASSRTSKNADGSISSTATITESAALPNKSRTWIWDLPTGLISISSNATLTCKYGDFQCASQCNAWLDCSTSWSSWSRNDIQIDAMNYDSITTKTRTLTSWDMSTSTYTAWYTQSAHTIVGSTRYSDCGWTTLSISSSPGWTKSWNDSPTCRTTHAYNASTYAEATKTFTYAIDDDAPVTTSTYTTTWPYYHPLVLSTLKPAPSCKYQSCTNRPNPSAASCGSCEVQGGTVELLYWADMATKTLRSNTTSTLSQPVTAIYKNMTLTSPTVYIEFRTAYATDACGYTVGNPHPGAIIGVDPNSLYSVYAKLDYFVDSLEHGDGSTTFYQSHTFNFHDLSGLPPGPTYQAQPSCWDNGCHTIFDDYHPVLVLPSQVRELDPAFASCGLDWRGAWDPPIALQPAEVLDPVTTAVEPKYTQPASPKSTVPPPATETAAAKGTTSTSVPQSTSSSDPTEALIQSSKGSKASPTSEDHQAQDISESGPSSLRVIVTLYPSQVSPGESDGLHDPVPGQRPTNDAALESTGTRSRSNNNAATDGPSDHTAPAHSDSIFVDPGVSNPSTGDSNGLSASPTNALDVMSEALKSLESWSVTAGLSSTVSIESFGSEIMDTTTLALVTAPQVPTGNSGAQTGSISHGGRTHTITTGNFADGTLVQPVETLSALDSQSMRLFSMDGSAVSASAYKSAGFQIGTHALTPGGDPAATGNNVLGAATGSSYEHVQFSLVLTTRTSRLPGSMTLDASVVAVSEGPKGDWIVDGHTLTQGGSPLVLGAHTISVGTGGLLKDGIAMNHPKPSNLATSSSIESSPGSRLPAVTTAHDANSHPSSTGQEDSARNRQSSTSTTSGAGQVPIGYYLTLSLCTMVSSLIALPYM
ncbi:hypothetical protein NU219Hw_g9164t1 [Hortaea werneckii]